MIIPSLRTQKKVLDQIRRELHERPRPLALRGAVQHYDWGVRGPRALIPRWLGVKPEPGVPYAELWFGAHPRSPSTVAGAAGDVPLDELIRADPKLFLGPRAARWRNELPFLAKIIDVARPLSLQIHPNARQARAGFRREEALGIPVDDPRRFYRDDRPKPELLMALTEFHAFAGFRPLGDVAAEARSCPALGDLWPRPIPVAASPTRQAAWRRRALERLFELRPAEAARVARAWVRGFRGTEPRTRWLCDVWKKHGQAHPEDPGFLILSLLDLARLSPGDSLFVPAGVLHTYLSGAAVEVMANSDNVLRGGLTAKPVDTRALLAVIDYAARPILTPAGRSLPSSDWFRVERSPRLNRRVPSLRLSLSASAKNGCFLFMPSVAPEIRAARSGLWIYPSAIDK